MGQFSWYTQDTHHRIVNDEDYKVVMTDDKCNQYVEHCYEGYGVFGGKDYYELLAEMNGLPSDRCAGIKLAFSKSDSGISEGVKYPSLTESGAYMGGAAPERDPNQGFRMDYDDDDDSYYDIEDWR